MALSKSDYTSANFQKFLDEQQYNKNGILRYEMIFGETYVSTGGQETTTKFCNDLELKVGRGFAHEANFTIKVGKNRKFRAA